MAISPTGLKKVLTDVKPDVKVDITPLYAVAGATDAVVAKLREVPGRVQAFKPALTVEPKAVREQVEARFATLQTAVVGLPVKAEAKASELSDKVVDTATSTYGVLATRGEKVVRAIRKQPEVAHAAVQVKAAKAP